MYVLIDLDGVCFNSLDRLIRCSIGDYAVMPYKPETRVSEVTGIHAIRGEFDWNKVFSNEEVRKDSVITNAPIYTKEIASYYDIIYLTSRSDNCKKGTLENLIGNDFAKGLLWMRKHGDYRPSSVVKNELIIEHEYKLNAPIVAAIDDDYDGKLKVMYKSLGIPHFYTLWDFVKDIIIPLTPSIKEYNMEYLGEYKKGD